MASTVGGYVVVPPAKSREVVGVVATAAFTAGNDMVDFEAVTTGAAVDGAASVTVEDETTHFGWNYPGERAYCQRPA